MGCVREEETDGCDTGSLVDQVVARKRLLFQEIDGGHKRRIRKGIYDKQGVTIYLLAKQVLSAQMSEMSLSGEGTVLRLKRDAWSQGKQHMGSPPSNEKQKSRRALSRHCRDGMGLWIAMHDMSTPPPPLSPTPPPLCAACVHICVSSGKKKPEAVVVDDSESFVQIQFTPTIPHCR